VTEALKLRSSPVLRLWAGQALLLTLAVAVVLAAPWPQPVPRLGAGAAIAAGSGAGAAFAVLCVAALLALSPVPGRRLRARVAEVRVAGARATQRPFGAFRWTTVAVVATAAACEEAIWRGGVLDGLAGPLGVPGALVVSAAGFGLAHGPARSRIGVHALTGLVFGGVHLATGRLAGAVAAHVAYNLALLAMDGRAAAPGRLQPVAGGGRS
jgi:membrane protease YdiL (CAAX protease family)